MTAQTMTPAPMSAPDPIALDDVVSGDPDRRVADLLTFAIAVEQGAGPGALPRLRQRAEQELSVEAVRRVHNEVERIRHEAVAQHLGRVRQPPGFPRLVLANLVALALFALAWSWWQGDGQLAGALAPALDRLGEGLARLWAAGGRLFGG